MKRKYKKAQIKRSQLKPVQLRVPTRDSYNELTEQLIATYPGCGHSCTSDERLKENIKSLPSMLAHIRSLRPVTFEWKKKIGEKKPELGLIAQEVEKLFPEAVSTDSNGYKQIAYHQLTAALIAAVQELASEIERLKK
jgi:hypothetical protein